MKHPVVHFEVTGRDGPALQRYYAELFGWEIDANEELGYGAVAPPPDRAGIGGGIGATPTGGPGHVTFYEHTPDIESALVKAEALGGKRVFGPAPVPVAGIEVGQFTDPEGHLIGLVRPLG